MQLALAAQQRLAAEIAIAKTQVNRESSVGFQGGNVMVPASPEEIASRTSAIGVLENNLETATQKTQLLYKAIVQLLKDPETKPKKPKTLKDLTGIDTSLIDSEIADIKLAIVKLKVALKDSSSFAETESTLKQIYDDEIRLIQLQLAKKLKLADDSEVAMKIAYTEYGIAEQAIIQKNNDAVNKLLDAQGNIVGDITKKNSKIVLTELQQLNKDLGFVITDGLVNALSGIGQAIGEGLANGTNILKGAGIALIALGSAFSASAKNIAPSGGGGGNVSGASTSAGGGLGSTGFTSSTSSGGFEGRVVFEIAGSKLIGVLNNTSRNDLRTGVDNGLITAG